ncbi:hypothetical protein DFH27DRAFT_485904 [Peziza echinospora]|nr:hypothetical protein DFH27DRAFT_485904 [Peziza echinospora]
MSNVPQSTPPGQSQALAQTNGHPPPPMHNNKPTIFQQLQSVNENVWLQIGSLTELMGDLENAMSAYEAALRQNPYSIPAMNSISCILRTKEQFSKAVEYLQSILNLDSTNGDIWGSLGHCYLMMDDLQKAYSAYQQALYHLRDPKEPKLWYGIGILYDRYGSLEHAEEAFSQVMRMDPNFEKANEIYFRLGIIYKQQQKYQQSLECFRYIVSDPPRPLTEEDIWFQIGHVHEQQKDYIAAKDAYQRVLENDPHHAKVLQQLGWLHHQQSNSFASQDLAIEYLEKSVSSDNSDAQSWYLLGRCYMSQQKYPKAYEAYQQAVYRDGRNPTFWCSIGVLYYQINQYRDALDAYSRAIRLNPYISEVWYDLGTLYESCNNQINDALDAYQRAAELDPTNPHIKARLQLLRSGQATGIPHQNSAPPPQDVHPHSYQAAGVNGPPNPQWASQPPQPPPARNHAPQSLPQLPPQQQQVSQSPYRQGEQQPLPRHPVHSPDHLRPAPNDTRHTPVRRAPSPPPKFNHPSGPSYPPPIQQQGPPPPLPPQQHQQQMQQHQQQQPPPGRILNPHHNNQHVLPPAQNGNGMTLPPYARSSPPPEVKPIVDDRLTSPTASYSHSQHHQPPGGIASGAPVPASATAAAEAAQRERDEKVTDVRISKRRPEWEEDDSVTVKKPASDENRVRPDEMRHLASPPRSGPRIASPADRRSSGERIRNEISRNDDYHQGPPPPHQQQHQQTLPSIGSNHQLAPISEGPRHEPPRSRPEDERDRKEVNEPAARKVDVDENYDDDDIEDIKRSGPNGHVVGGGNGVEKKSSPISGNGSAGNGVTVGQSGDREP